MGWDKLSAENGLSEGGGDVAGASLKDQWSVKKTRDRVPLGTVVENGEELRVLRWSKRARRS